MKTILTLIFLHIAFFLLGSTLFILSFHTGLFKGINIFFYRGIILLAVTSALMAIFAIFYKKSKYGIFTYRDVALSVVLIFCINLVFFTHLPVTADRSISVFLLGYMNKYSDKAVTFNEITKIFTQKYLYEYGAIDKRLNEQIVSGNIINNGNAYKITKQGKSLIEAYVFVADVFNVNKRLISP
jgi:hypothetical protein